MSGGAEADARGLRRKRRCLDLPELGLLFLQYSGWVEEITQCRHRTYGFQDFLESRGPEIALSTFRRYAMNEYDDTTTRRIPHSPRSLRFRRRLCPTETVCHLAPRNRPGPSRTWGGRCTPSSRTKLRRFHWWGRVGRG